jgi:hypothetical protein
MCAEMIPFNKGTEHERAKQTHARAVSATWGKNLKSCDSCFFTCVVAKLGVCTYPTLL